MGRNKKIQCPDCHQQMRSDSLKSHRKSKNCFAAVQRDVQNIQTACPFKCPRFTTKHHVRRHLRTCRMNPQNQSINRQINSQDVRLIEQVHQPQTQNLNKKKEKKIFPKYGLRRIRKTAYQKIFDDKVQRRRNKWKIRKQFRTPEEAIFHQQNDFLHGDKSCFICSEQMKFIGSKTVVSCHVCHKNVHRTCWLKNKKPQCIFCRGQMTNKPSFSLHMERFIAQVFKQWDRMTPIERKKFELPITQKTKCQVSKLYPSLVDELVDPLTSYLEYRGTQQMEKFFGNKK